MRWRSLGRTVLWTAIVVTAVFTAVGLPACSSHPATPAAVSEATSATSTASNAAASPQAVSHFDNFSDAPSPAALNAPSGAAKSSHVVAMAQDIAQSGEHPHDAVPAVHEIFQIDAFQITVPIGTLGRNETFWKQIDEQCVDVATYDLLFKNGMRVGVAPMSAFDVISGYLTPDAQTQKVVISGLIGKKVQLETRKELAWQNIFYFDRDNALVGRTFDRSTNFIDLSFEPTPRQPGSIRVDFAPEVKAYRAQLEFTILNEEREFQFVAPETFYDLNCQADIPRDHFLILAPSADADHVTSVGHAFLVNDASPKRMEQVIVLVPHAITPEELQRAQAPQTKSVGKASR